MQIPSRIGVCGAVDGVPAVAVAGLEVAVVAGLEVVAGLAVAGAVVAGLTAAGEVDLTVAVEVDLVAVALAVPAPALASTMLAVNAADPAKSDRVPIARSAPLHIARMVWAEEMQNLFKLGYISATRSAERPRHREHRCRRLTS
jgi:hypothetical protein